MYDTHHVLIALFVFQTTNYDSVLQTAESIAKQAHDLAYDPNYMSPFAQFACDNGLNVRGETSDLSPWGTVLDLALDLSSGYTEAKCPPFTFKTHEQHYIILTPPSFLPLLLCCRWEAR